MICRQSYSCIGKRVEKTVQYDLFVTYHRDKYIVPPAVHDMYRHLCRLAAGHAVPFKLPHYDSVALFVISLAVRLFKHGIIKITIKHLCRSGR